MSAIQPLLDTRRQIEPTDFFARAVEGVLNFVRCYRAAATLAERAEQGERLTIEDLRLSGLI